MGFRVIKSNITDSKIFVIVSLLMLLCCMQFAIAQEKFPLGELSVRTSEMTYNFAVELALDDSHRQYGMMFRTSNPETNGMLFVYDKKKRISMWMKNTFIPLDILFINEDGKIMRIEQSAQPRSLTLIRSGGEAKAVLELNGGLTKKLNINVGDEIIHTTFGNITK